MGSGWGLKGTRHGLDTAREANPRTADFGWDDGPYRDSSFWGVRPQTTLRAVGRGAE